MNQIVDFSLNINPIKILIIFFSISFISICLDQAGFFEYVANKILGKSKNSNFLFFLLLYLTVSVLTVFTSNDIVVLTFTPFICYYCKAKKINPLPYLFIEFIAANTWSMMLEIGNPTNIYLGLSTNISFIDYFKVMGLPTLGAGLTSFGLILLIFRKDIFTVSNEVKDEIEVKIYKFPLLVSLIDLIVCILGIAIFFNYVIYICLGCAILLLIILSIYLI